MPNSCRQALQLNPFPMEQSVVLMDNCWIHHDEDIQAIIEQECGMLFMSSGFKLND